METKRLTINPRIVYILAMEVNKKPVTQYAKDNGYTDSGRRRARMIARNLNIGQKEFGMRFIDDAEWLKIVEFMNRDKCTSGVKKLSLKMGVTPACIYKRISILGIKKKSDYTADEEKLITAGLKRD